MQPTTVTAPSKFDFGFHVVGPFRRKVIEGLVAKGMTQDEAGRVVGKIGDGTILNWIITHGPDIVAFIEMIIALFPK